MVLAPIGTYMYMYLILPCPGFYLYFLFISPLIQCNNLYMYKYDCTYTYIYIYTRTKCATFCSQTFNTYSGVRKIRGHGLFALTCLKMAPSFKGKLDGFLTNGPFKLWISLESGPCPYSKFWFKPQNSTHRYFTFVHVHV